MLPRLETKSPVPFFWNFCFGKKYVPERGEFLLNHARSGILLALQAMNMEHGSFIGVMAYNCDSVASAIKNAGHNPVFIDVTYELRISLSDLENKKGSLSAIVVSHLFGIPNEIEKIQDVCKGIPIIEDCAHAYGSEFKDGSMCGSKGDFAVFSVGFGKFPSLGDGGILKVNNEKYIDPLSSIIKSLKCYTVTEEMQLFSKLVVRRLAYIPFVYGFVVRFKKQRTADSDKWDVKLMSTGISRLWNATKPIMLKLRDQKRQCMEFVIQSLRGLDGVRLLEHCPWQYSNAFMLPIYCVDKQRVSQHIRTKKIEAITHFSMSIKWNKAFGYKAGDCPNTEMLLQHLLMLPCYKKYKI